MERRKSPWLPFRATWERLERNGHAILETADADHCVYVGYCFVWAVSEAQAQLRATQKLNQRYAGGVFPVSLDAYRDDTGRHPLFRASRLARTAKAPAAPVSAPTTTTRRSASKPAAQILLEFPFDRQDA